MIDKVWFDWQNKHKENFWSFFGGSVGSHSQPGLYRQFPAGGPPFLNVSELSTLIALPLHVCLFKYSLAWHADADRWNPHEGFDLRRHGYQGREVVLRL